MVYPQQGRGKQKGAGTQAIHQSVDRSFERRVFYANADISHLRLAKQAVKPGGMTASENLDLLLLSNHVS